MDKISDGELRDLLNILPHQIQQNVFQHDDSEGLLEIILDLGRVPEARYLNKSTVIGSENITDLDIRHVTEQIGEFGDDNRAGIERTLHRISAIRNRNGKVIGLTLRVGRAIYGTIGIIQDLILSEKSVLLLGKPGVGKTTMLREVARVLADDAKKRVIVVDTSNEIGGDGDIPHPGIGKARRMHVKTPSRQHAVMIEGVENHMPEVIVIDEIGTEDDADAARTIAERGVQLVATAHGNSLENLIMNPTLSDLVGGVHTVTLGDVEASRRGTQKTVRERRAPPTFDVLVEIQGWNHVIVHENVSDVVDRILRGHPLSPSVRKVDEDGAVHHSKVAARVSTLFNDETSGNAYRHNYRLENSRTKPLFSSTVEAEFPHGDPITMTNILPYGINKGRLLQVVDNSSAPVRVVTDMADADLLLTTKNYYRRRTQVLKTAELKGKPVYVLRKNTLPQIQNFIQAITRKLRADERIKIENTEAIDELEIAVSKIEQGTRQIELNPQSSYVRRVQHKIADKYGMKSSSFGSEPNRYVVIYKK